MFEIFILLFGGIYFGIKYINDKNKAKESENKLKEMQIRREYIQNKYCADMETSLKIKEYILCGEHFNEICDTFESDFQYVFGDDWREKLRIPPKPPILDPKIYKSDAYSFLMPINHIYWVYHLMLAKEGKIDRNVVFHGYGIGGVLEKDMNIRFAKCIEDRLIESGALDIRLALELDSAFTSYPRNPDDVCGGDIMITSLCTHPIRRLW